MKEYKIRFYAGGSQGSSTIAQLLDAEIAHQSLGAVPNTHQVGDRYVDLSDLVNLNNGSVYKGVIRLLRDDAPHKRDASGVETPLNLSVGDKIVEKNHFIFYAINNLLVWQTNATACHYSTLAGLLTCLSGQNTTVTFSDILSPSALQKIQTGDLKKLKVKFASPRNARQYDPHDWTDLSRQFATSADNAKVTIEISVGKSPTTLPERFKTLLLGLVPNAHGEVEALHASVADQKEPIDLLGECIKDKMRISLNGEHYPRSSDVFAELDSAKTRQQVSLNAFFGT